jgi:DNA-binding transcriptional LysR family regulator
LHLRTKGFNILSVVEENKSVIDFRHLETFCRVAQLKSFTKAADDLCLTQPTISGHILSLEQSLSLRLFDRTGREVRLTKAGEMFHRYASKILSIRKEALNALSEFSLGIRGELSLGASTIPGEYLLPKLIGGFKKEHPRFTISLKIADTKEIVHSVQQGSVEFGMIGARLTHELLHYDPFEEDKIIIIGPLNPHRSQRQKISFDQMLKKPWIIREEGSGTQMAVEKVLRKKGKSLKQFNVVMEMGSTSSVKEGVKAGLGFAFISKIAVQEELNQGLLSRIDVEGIEPISRQIYIVSHRGRTLSPIGIEFLRFLKRSGEETKDTN